MARGRAHYLDDAACRLLSIYRRHANWPGGVARGDRVTKTLASSQIDVVVTAMPPNTSASDARANIGIIFIKRGFGALPALVIVERWIFNPMFATSKPVAPSSLT